MSPCLPFQSADCVCATCAEIARMRGQLILWANGQLGTMVAKLGPQAGRQAILGAIALSLGDTIGAFVPVERQAQDIDSVGNALKQLLANDARDGATVQ